MLKVVIVNSKTQVHNFFYFPIEIKPCINTPLMWFHFYLKFLLLYTLIKANYTKHHIEFLNCEKCC